MCTGVIPHEVSVVGHFPTILIPTYHAHAEVEPDVIVQCTVVLGSVRAHITIHVCYFGRKCFALEPSCAAPFYLGH